MTTNPSSTVSPLLQVKHLSKRFPIRRGFWNRQVGAVQAVTNVSFNVKAGETLGIVGESGCGKSTLGRSILQLLRPSEGQVLLDGHDLTQLKNRQLRPLRRHMQMVFQNPYSSLNPRMSIRDTLAEPLIVHKMAKGSELQSRLEQLIDQVGLPQTALKKFPHEFSGGQRQRVGIARALALNPKLIVADEPVSALDVSVQAQILNLLKTLRSELGLTYLFIAHNLDVVRYISDRVVVMYLGQVVELTDAQTLYEAPLHPYTQALLAAAPVANVEEAKARLASRTLLEGDPPNPADPPNGCRFHTRCPHVTDRCRVEMPQLKAVKPGHEVACHLTELL